MRSAPTCGAPECRSDTSATRRPSRAGGQRAPRASSRSRTRSLRGSCQSARQAIAAAARPAAATPALTAGPGRCMRAGGSGSLRRYVRHSIGAMEFLRSGDPGYEAARKPAIARFHDVRPAAVVRCGSADDVAAALAFARAADLPVAVRSGGHCFAGRSSTTGVVIDVAPMDGVAVAEGEATIGAGARLGPVYDALDAHGVTIPAGCGTEVGVSGLTLGGGLGLLGRMHGLTSDRLIGAEVVLADGGTVACDADHDPDLLWALRGAGAGGFGVVTALRFATLPAPAVATRLHAEWPVGAAAAVAAAWQEWAPDGPDELAATLLLGGGGATITGAYVGPQAEAEMLMAELAAAAGSMPPPRRAEGRPDPPREAGPARLGGGRGAPAPRPPGRPPGLL